MNDALSHEPGGLPRASADANSCVPRGHAGITGRDAFLAAGGLESGQLREKAAESICSRARTCRNEIGRVIARAEAHRAQSGYQG